MIKKIPYIGSQRWFRSTGYALQHYWLAKAYDHANHRYRFGFRMLTLGWSDGSTFLPVNSVLLSSENRKNRVNETTEVDKRTVGYQRRMLSMQKGAQAMLELLKTAKKMALPARYVLFDSWFSSPSTLHAVKSIGYDVIGMVKSLISHGSRHFKCCFRCFRQYLWTTQNCVMIKSMSWLIRL